MPAVGRVADGRGGPSIRLWLRPLRLTPLMPALASTETSFSRVWSSAGVSHYHERWAGLIYINSTNHPLQKAIIDLAVQHIEALESKHVFWFGWIAVLLLTNQQYVTGAVRTVNNRTGQ